MEPFVDCPRIRIPKACRGVEIMVGIDEAGRGPVLGSLVYTAAFWPVSENDSMKIIGFNDSKQVKETDRNSLFEKMKLNDNIGWVTEELTAEYISENMLRVNPISLNTLSYDAVVRALQSIMKCSESDVSQLTPIITNVYVDTVGDPNYYKSQLTKHLGEDFANFTIEKKADAKYPIVGAASIIAKVTRDKILKDWQWIEESAKRSLDKDYGSGYPGDEKCVQWLQRSQHPLFGYPNLVRFSWSTTKDLLIVNKKDHQNKNINVEWECDEDPDLASTSNIANYFSDYTAASNVPHTVKKRTKRGEYFVNKKLKQIDWTEFDK